MNTDQLAQVIRSAADRLTTSHGTGEPQAVEQIAGSLRQFADSLGDDTANALLEAVGRIARATPSAVLAESVMAGLVLEQADTSGQDAPAMPAAEPGQPGAGFMEQALELLGHSLQGKAHGKIAGAGEHPLPLALAAVSIAWLLAQPVQKEAAGPGDDAGPAAAGSGPQPHREAAIAPGGLGYLMTLSSEEEEQIEWGSREVT